MAQSLFEYASKENKQKINIQTKQQILREIANVSSKESENIIRQRLNLPHKPRKIIVEVSEATHQAWIKFKGQMGHKNFSDEKLLNQLLALAETNRIAAPIKSPAIRAATTAAKIIKSKYQRYITAEVKRSLFAQAKECQYPGCKSTYCLEIHHIRPIAQGGNSTIENLQILCRNHNQFLDAR